MNGRHVLILVLALLGFAGMHHAFAQQQADPFRQAKCQEDFVSLRGAVETRGKALQAAGKRKAPPPEACKLLRDYVNAEARMIKFLKEEQQTCGIPPQILNQASEGHSKSTAMRNQVCQAAANPPAPPPSQGLSGALGTPGVGGPPAETAGGSGVFDTLTGNVLRR